MLLADRNKCKRIDKDPAIMRLDAVQSLINKVFNPCEIYEGQKKLMRPKAAQIARAYGLSKIHKPFQRLPNFDQSLTLKTHLIRA